MTPTESELLELYRSLDPRRLEDRALKNRIDALIRERRRDTEQCLHCGEDCTCQAERDEWETQCARDKRSAA